MKFFGYGFSIQIGKNLVVVLSTFSWPDECVPAGQEEYYNGDKATEGKINI